MLAIRSLALATVAAMALSLGVMGCQAERPDVIPSSAQLWSSGNGTLHYQAPADGMVYIYDHPQQRLIWSGKIMRGQSVDVDPAKGQIMAGGAIVVNKIAAPADDKDIYFDQSPIQSAQSWNNNPNPTNTSNGVVVTPNVTVQPTNGQPTNNGSVTVQPGVTVTPAPNTPNP